MLSSDTTIQHHRFFSPTFLLSFDRALGSGQIQSSSTAIGETVAGIDAEPEATGASEVDPPSGFEAKGVVAKGVVAKTDAKFEGKTKSGTSDEVDNDAGGKGLSGSFCSEKLGSKNILVVCESINARGVTAKESSSFPENENAAS